MNTKEQASNLLKRSHCLIPDNIKGYVVSSQSNKKGIAIVAAGDVREFKIGELANQTQISALVHAELRADTWYKVNAILSEFSVEKSECACNGRSVPLRL